MRACAILAALFVGPAGAADEKPTIKEIPAKDLKLNAVEKGKPTEPQVVTADNDLPKVGLLTAAAVEEVRKHVDFSKQKLVVFAWAGSGQDKMTASIGAEGKDAIVFVEYLPGRTRDLRQHVRLYVVPKDLKVVVERGK